MMFTPEWQLLALALGLHLQDAILLLYANEGILACSLAGTWSLRLGSPQARLFGRELLLPHLLLVHRPLYRLQWNFEQAPRGDIAAWQPRTELLRPVGFVVMAIGVVQFLVFPLVLLVYLTDLALLLTIGGLYLCILLGLVLVGRSREALGMSQRQYWGLCFECVICPPIAVNLVRKVSLTMSRACDLTQVAQVCLANDAWARARALLGERLQTELTFLEEGSAPYQAMQRRHAQLLSAGSPAHVDL